MRAIVISEQAGPDRPVAEVVKLVNDWPDPGAPGSGLVLVRTLATALNHLDLWVGHGVPGLNLSYPRISGSDACGVVEAVGAGVDPAWVGRRVILNAAMTSGTIPHPDDSSAASSTVNYELIGEHHNGAMAEKFLAPVGNLAAVDPTCDAGEAAAFGLTFLTAYSMMIGKAGLRAGQTVLVTGIGGGVALAALAIARHAGCPVAVTSRHAWKLERARQLGAAFTSLDTGQDWSKEIRKWAGGRGVDLAVDSSGKATHIKCIKSLARGGAYVSPGCTSGPDAVTDLARLFWNQLRIIGSTMGSPREFGEIASLFREGRLRPVVDNVYSPDRAAEAYARLESAEQFGKVVVRWE